MTILGSNFGDAHDNRDRVYYMLNTSDSRSVLLTEVKIIETIKISYILYLFKNFENKFFVLAPFYYFF